MKKTHLRILALLCAVVMALGLFGCAKDEPAQQPADNTPAAAGDQAPGAPAENTEPPAEDNQPAEPAPQPAQTVDHEGVTWAFQQDEYKLCCYWPGPDEFFDNYVLQGIKGFEADFGQTVEYAVGTEWTQNVENQTVEALAAQGYDCFMIFGADTAGANGLYKELYDNGCQVINYAGLVDDPQESAFTLASNVYTQAYESTKQLIEYMGGEGTIINVLENLNDVNTVKRQQGVEDAVAEHPNVSICQTVADIKTVDEGYTKVSDALTANPDAKGIIATGGTASKGVANALSDYYATNASAEHVFAATQDQSTEVMNGIAAGQIDHTVGQNGYGMGYVSNVLLMYLKDGWTPKTWGQHIDTGMVFITKDNMDTYQKDIEQVTNDLVATIETDILNKP
ncbi:MAG: substrate-binding domain-containing protein [Oscillospiraceae bacterium]|nr:substrate-binding domain-containing protein [Oscillospiraceae bacterium]